MSETKKYYIVEEAAEILGVSVDQLKAWRPKGPIVTHRGRSVMYRHKYLMKYKEARENAAEKLKHSAIHPTVAANVKRYLSKPKLKGRVEPTEPPEVIPKKKGGKKEKKNG